MRLHRKTTRLWQPQSSTSAVRALCETSTCPKIVQWEQREGGEREDLGGCDVLAVVQMSGIPKVNETPSVAAGPEG